MLSASLVIGALLVPAPGPGQDAVVKGLSTDGLPEVFVLDDRGTETRGRLVRIDDETVVLLVGAAQRRFETRSVQRISRRGDSLRNGAIAGAVFGAVMGTLAAYMADCRNARGGIGGCGVLQGSAFIVGSTLFYTSLGIGLDALVAGRTRIYEAPPASRSSRAGRLSAGLTFRW